VANFGLRIRKDVDHPGIFSAACLVYPLDKAKRFVRIV
jgi:hypothetical protein